MSKEIQFQVGKTKVREGDYVVISWQCDSPDAVSLTVDNGLSPYNVQLADSGSRSVTIEKSKGKKTVLRLNVVYNGKVERKELEVKVEEVREAKAPKARQARPARSFRNPFRNFKANWNSFKYRLRYGWQVMPEKKRRIYKAIMYGLLAVWLFSIVRTCGYQAGYQKGLESAPQSTISTV